jgi:hypothetical protein
LGIAAASHRRLPLQAFFAMIRSFAPMSIVTSFVSGWALRKLVANSSWVVV